MYTALFLFILILVHIQWIYCTQVGVCFLKLLETALIVFAIQIYLQYDQFEMPFNSTILEGFAEKWQLFRNVTSEFRELWEEAL
jgi:putative effector of murein hydrolase